MKAVDFLRIGEEFLKTVSKSGLRIDDYRHVRLYEEYIEMRFNGDKVDYILYALSHKYKLSESTIKRIVKRLSREVNIL